MPVRSRKRSEFSQLYSPMKTVHATRRLGQAPATTENSDICIGNTNDAPVVKPRRHCNDLHGAGERIRTADPVITSDVLYQLSYTSPALHPDPRRESGRPEKQDGATPQNRTGDTAIFSRVLYQLS